MAVVIHNARVTGPIAYTAGSGATVHLPLGPCAIEQLEGLLVDVIWGPDGSESARLSTMEMEAAVLRGDLVWLDPVTDGPPAGSAR